MTKQDIVPTGKLIVGQSVVTKDGTDGVVESYSPAMREYTIRQNGRVVTIHETRIKQQCFEAATEQLRKGDK